MMPACSGACITSLPCEMPALCRQHPRPLCHMHTPRRPRPRMGRTGRRGRSCKQRQELSIEGRLTTCDCALSLPVAIPFLPCLFPSSVCRPAAPSWLDSCFVACRQGPSLMAASTYLSLLWSPSLPLPRLPHCWLHLPLGTLLRPSTLMPWARTQTVVQTRPFRGQLAPITSLCQALALQHFLMHWLRGQLAPFTSQCWALAWQQPSPRTGLPLTRWFKGLWVELYQQDARVCLVLSLLLGLLTLV